MICRSYAQDAANPSTAGRSPQVQDARTARGKGKGKDRMGMRGVISQGEAMRRVCETTYAYDEEESETIR